MGRRLVVVGGLTLIGLGAAFVIGEGALAGNAPEVSSVIEGHDGATDRAIVIVIGKKVGRFKRYLARNKDTLEEYEPELALKDKTMIVLRLPSEAPVGAYELELGYGRDGVQVHTVQLGKGSPMPASIKTEALDSALLADLQDAATLGGQGASYYRDASHLDAGVLSSELYSAYSDLVAEGHVGSLANQVAEGDHDHDGWYCRRGELGDPGTLNDAGNALDWTRLKNVPDTLADGEDADTTYSAGTGLGLTQTTFFVHDVPWASLTGVPLELADGDDDTVYTAGDGLSLVGSAFSTRFGGTGVAATSSRSDHDHDGTYLQTSGDTMTGALTIGAASGPVLQAEHTATSGTGAIARLLDNGTERARFDKDGAVLLGGAYAGTWWTNPPPASGAGTRWMWYPNMAAFRVGFVTGTEWDASKVGDFSLATGADTIASGLYSTAMGRESWATGDHATALGYKARAGGWSSSALGQSSTASGYASTAGGFQTTASGNYSTALGNGSTASGDYSTAMGYQSTASGDYAKALGSWAAASGWHSTSLGNSTTASGVNATAMGYVCTASGNDSTAMGHNNDADSYASVFLGRFATTNAGRSKTTWSASDPLLVAGDGTSTSSRSNCLELSKNGNLWIQGTLTQASDERLKTDIEPLTNVLPRLADLSAVSYRYRDTENSPAGRQIGVLAQEVQAAFPELVRTDAEGHLAVAYGNFTAVLLEAVKEQQTQLTAQDREIARLRTELERLRQWVLDRSAQPDRRSPNSAAPSGNASEGGGR